MAYMVDDSHLTQFLYAKEDGDNQCIHNYLVWSNYWDDTLTVVALRVLKTELYSIHVLQDLNSHDLR